MPEWVGDVRRIMPRRGLVGLWCTVEVCEGNVDVGSTWFYADGAQRARPARLLGERQELL